MSSRNVPVLFAASIVVAMAATPLLRAEEEKELGWSDVAEFSWVATSGNSETDTIGFKDTLLHRWEDAAFELNAGGIRAETTTITRSATGDPNNPTVTESKFSEKTAENYYLNGKYGHTISERTFWYASAGWERNEFAGVKNRYSGSGGVGNIWVDKEKMSWRTDYGVTYTDQEDVVDNPMVDSSFAGVRASSTYKQHFGDKTKTTYGNDTILDYNIDETDDRRANMINWVAVGMSDMLALKVSLQWLYDNLPSLELVPFTPAPPATVAVPLDELDTIFTTSLVVNF
jgi:putative salt-induced outer membrane protein YdiY